MATDILNATVATVKIGYLEFEGLLIEGSIFGISQQQLASIFQVIPTSAPKWLKRLVDKDCSLFSVKTNRELIENKRVRSAEKAIDLETFERVLKVLFKEDNPVAKEIVGDLIGLSLTQLFSDAFSVKFEKQERQDYLASRQEGKKVRRTLTDSIQDYCRENDKLDRQTIYYIHVSDGVNVAIFGAKSKQLKEQKGLKKNDLLRDSFTASELKEIERYEDRIIEYIDLDNVKPIEAMKLTVNRMNQLSK